MQNKKYATGRVQAGGPRPMTWVEDDEAGIRHFGLGIREADRPQGCGHTAASTPRAKASFSDRDLRGVHAAAGGVVMDGPRPARAPGSHTGPPQADPRGVAHGRR